MSLETQVERWNRWWFPASTGFRLAVSRIVVVATSLLFFMTPLWKQRALLERAEGFIEPQWLIKVISMLVPHDLFFNYGTFRLLYVSTIVAGIFCLVGLFTRPAAFLFAAGNWLFVSHVYSYGEEHHAEAVMSLFLLLLALSPSGRRFSSDAWIKRTVGGSQDPDTTDLAIWPLKLTQLLLVWSYVSNGLSKLVYGGPDWMNGFTLKQHVLGNAVSWDMPLGLWFVQVPQALAVLLSIGTILIETLFFLVLIFPRTLPFFLVAGALMHIGIYFTMHAAFFQSIVLYIVFIDFDRWETWWQEHSASWKGPLRAWARS